MVLQEQNHGTAVIIPDYENDVGRGVRYNSINNYVLQQERGIYVGIVISEDGIINVIQNRGHV